jgi:hypothetical protein
LWLPAEAQDTQDDPCDACIADWSWAECPCLPVTDEPPPISAATCSPATHAVAGCENKVFLPVVSGVTQ